MALTSSAYFCMMDARWASTRFGLASSRARRLLIASSSSVASSRLSASICASFASSSASSATLAASSSFSCSKAFCALPISAPCLAVLSSSTIPCSIEALLHSSSALALTSAKRCADLPPNRSLRSCPAFSRSMVSCLSRTSSSSACLRAMRFFSSSLRPGTERATGRHACFSASSSLCLSTIALLFADSCMAISSSSWSCSCCAALPCCLLRSLEDFWLSFLRRSLSSPAICSSESSLVSAFCRANIAAEMARFLSLRRFFTASSRRVRSSSWAFFSFSCCLA
mmetsp:Transcript_37827/g.62716  ORF Transcript_37827/g.62716 Transcript_37827/m.62716 type:complete len:284 (-) Transcript_37827:3042-3893(-)